MVPAAVVDRTVADLLPHLDEGDVLIDGGNSYYVDDIRRARNLPPKGIHYLDVGTSGGVWGLERGYCMMIGGPDQAVKHSTRSSRRYARCGRHPRTRGARGRRHRRAGLPALRALGAGHFVKMVHNGIEYGVMAAYAEGLAILRDANIGKQQHEIDAETTPLRDPEDTNTTSICPISRRCGGAAA